MKSAFIYFFTLLFFSQVAVSAERIKHNTVNDYLKQEKEQGKKANNLLNETSPYLLQHAYNPVNWYAWGEAAFDKARKENKPIFLSIGYSTCHWCHVMAHESFENEQIASLLNKYFVCIKVDREQRPDIDSVYMSATQLINGHGGWPMTVFIDHKLRPFHAATYYPPFSTEKSLGLKDILLRIQDLWIKQPAEIDRVATAVTLRITAMADDTLEQESLLENIHALALQQINNVYDEDFGGFSTAPKFPRPGMFALLNQLSLVATKTPMNKQDDLSDGRNNEISARQMMKTTLDAMASGGIFDQIAGGFHRYSVDESWQVPHFEKMLYNQALMVMAYSDFYQIEPQHKYKQVVYQTLNFVREEMQSAQGGFYSALDADSERADNPGEHTEGAYYLWHEDELKTNLTAAEFEFIKNFFHIGENGNIDSDPRNEFTNLNIFYIDEAFRNKDLTQQQIKWLASASKKLNSIRRSRPRPHLDDKVITAWNGMMLTAFAKASVAFSDPALLDKAADTISFVKKHLYNAETKKLYRQYRSKKASTEAILADYVWLIYGLLEVYQADKDIQLLDWAVELQKNQNELFLDNVSGAYFESAANDTNLLFRSKSIYDGALPSANAIALSNLRKLSELSITPSQKKVYSLQADKLVSSFAMVVNQNPAAASMLLAVEVKQ